MQQPQQQLQLIDQRDVLGKEFRVYGTFEDPLFLARDVAEWVDYSKTSRGDFNAKRMIQAVDDDEKLTLTIFMSGQKRNMWFLSEDGLYDVLMLSRKPVAKAFKKKVKQILKVFRRAGRYAAPPQSREERLIQGVAKYLGTAQSPLIRTVITPISKVLSMEALEWILLHVSDSRGMCAESWRAFSELAPLYGWKASESAYRRAYCRIRDQVFGPYRPVQLILAVGS